jgi:hypothetical protein
MGSLYGFDLVFAAALFGVSTLLAIDLRGRLRSQDGIGSWKNILPAVAAVSLVWVLVGILWHGALGPDYSNARFRLIGTNLFTMIAVAILAIVIRSQRSVLLSIAAFGLAFVWLLVGAASSVV